MLRNRPSTASLATSLEAKVDKSALEASLGRVGERVERLASSLVDTRREAMENTAAASRAANEARTAVNTALSAVAATLAARGKEASATAGSATAPLAAAEGLRASVALLSTAQAQWEAALAGVAGRVGQLEVGLAGAAQAEALAEALDAKADKAAVAAALARKLPCSALPAALQELTLSLHHTQAFVKGLADSVRGQGKAVEEVRALQEAAAAAAAAAAAGAGAGAGGGEEACRQAAATAAQQCIAMHSGAIQAAAKSAEAAAKGAEAAAAEAAGLVAAATAAAASAAAAATASAGGGGAAAASRSAALPSSPSEWQQLPLPSSPTVKLEMDCSQEDVAGLAHVISQLCTVLGVDAGAAASGGSAAPAAGGASATASPSAQLALLSEKLAWIAAARQ